MTYSRYTEDIISHYERHWSQAVEQLRLDTGPIHQLPADFHIGIYERTSKMFAFATVSMSLASDESRLELHTLANHPSLQKAAIVEVMTSVAHYHRTGRALGVGHTVNLGRGIIPGSACEYGLISLPYLDGPNLEWMDEPRVRFLWLVPITAREVSYKKEHGLEALETRFEESRFDYLDPFRDSVV